MFGWLARLVESGKLIMVKIVKDCGTCKYQKTRPKEKPCNVCSVNASGYITSMWKKK